MKVNKDLLRAIPKIDEVLQNERLFFFMENTPRAVVVDTVREVIDNLREEILSGKLEAALSIDELIVRIHGRMILKSRKNLRRVINATGVILHTNLGRANLSKRAINAVCDVAGSYSNLEYDLKKGARGSRYEHVEGLINKILGTEAAMVVNNNAAATMLCLSAMAKGKEVIVSRGELVEIGGSFRIPDIMEESGAILREVGTTNKTRLSDYKIAVKDGITGALLKVHTSNYRIVGFQQETSLLELTALGKELNLPVIYDMGSGLLTDLSAYGLDEPTAPAAVATGIDVILFSGDKLLGGPQSGIIAGKKKYIDTMKQHPLARAFRVDKMTLAAMDATFFDYQDMNQAKSAIPVLDMLTISADELEKRAHRLCGLIMHTNDAIEVHVEACKDQVGGGSAPTVLLDGYAVVISGKKLTAEKIERFLRKWETPVIARIAHDRVCLNVRTILEPEFDVIASALAEIDKI